MIPYLLLLFAAANGVSAIASYRGPIYAALEGDHKQLLTLSLEHPKLQPQEEKRGQLYVKDIFARGVTPHEAPDSVVILRPQRGGSPIYGQWLALDTEEGKDRLWLKSSGGMGGLGAFDFLAGFEEREGSGNVAVLEPRRTGRTVTFEKEEVANYGGGDRARTILKPIIEGFRRERKKLFACEHKDQFDGSVWVLKFGMDYQLFDLSGQKCPAVTLLVKAPIPLKTHKPPLRAITANFPTNDEIYSRFGIETPQTPRTPIKVEHSDSSRSITPSSRTGLTMRDPFFPGPTKKVRSNPGVFTFSPRAVAGSGTIISPKSDFSSPRNLKSAPMKYYVKPSHRLQLDAIHNRGPGREYIRVPAIQAYDDECLRVLKWQQRSTKPQFVVKHRQVVEAARTMGVNNPGVRMVWLFTLEGYGPDQDTIIRCEGPTLHRILPAVPEVGDWVEDFYMQQVQQNIRRTKGWGSIIVQAQETLRRTHLVNGLWTLQNTIVLGQTTKSYRFHNMETGYAALFNEKIINFIGLDALTDQFQPIERDVAPGNEQGAVLKSFFRMDRNYNMENVRSWDQLNFRLETAVPEIHYPNSTYYYQIPYPKESHMSWTPAFVFCAKQQTEKKRCYTLIGANRGRLKSLTTLLNKYLAQSTSVLHLDRWKLRVQERNSKLQAMARANFGRLRAGEMYNQEDINRLITQWNRIHDGNDSEEVTEHEEDGDEIDNDDSDDDMDDFQIKRRPANRAMQVESPEPETAPEAAADPDTIVKKEEEGVKIEDGVVEVPRGEHVNSLGNPGASQPGMPGLVKMEEDWAVPDDVIERTKKDSAGRNKKDSVDDDSDLEEGEIKVKRSKGRRRKSTRRRY